LISKNDATGTILSDQLKNINFKHTTTGADPHVKVGKKDGAE